MNRPFTAPTLGQSYLQATSRGFTLIELLVTLSIVLLATGLVMVRYVSFNSSVLLNNLAYQIAFDLRETQSLAVSVRGSDTGGGGDYGFKEEYGMYFDLATPQQYILFQDSNDSLRGIDDQSLFIRYDAEAEEMVGNPIIIDPRFTIVDICVTAEFGDRECAGGDSNNVGGISIAFARPDFDAALYESGGDVHRRLTSVEIVIGSGSGDSDITRSVIVTSGGQITVQ